MFAIEAGNATLWAAFIGLVGTGVLAWSQFRSMRRENREQHADNKQATAEKLDELQGHIISGFDTTNRHLERIDERLETHDDRLDDLEETE